MVLFQTYDTYWCCLKRTTHLWCCLKSTTHVWRNLKRTTLIWCSLKRTTHVWLNLKRTTHLCCCLNHTTHQWCSLKRTTHLWCCLKRTTPQWCCLKRTIIYSPQGEITQTTTQKLTTPSAVSESPQDPRTPPKIRYINNHPGIKLPDTAGILQEEGGDRNLKSQLHLVLSEKHWCSPSSQSALT